ncbi:MAG: sigma-70 family RNA polymerase sigma factor [Pseudomonadales bacterium]
MLGSASDETLVSRALAGSNGAWTKLVQRYERRIYNYALRMVGHPDDAADLLQEVFVGVYRNLSGYRGDASFKSWLFRIASYRCTDYLRRRRVHDSFDENDETAPSAADPLGDALTTHANREISHALAGLPEEQRHVVELKFFQDFTFEDIAAQLGISPNTAKTRLYTALRKLKQNEELRHAL